VASSESVVGLARTGAVEAVGLTLEGLFRQHADDVHRIVRRLLGLGATQADVDDLVQQVFLAVHRALPSFRGESKTSTWIYGIASRIVLEHLRGWRRYRVMVARLEEEPARVERPDGRLESRDELRRVWRCLMRIKPKKRVVFVLHEIEGLSGPEIAEMLAINEATVRSRLHHARRELMAALRKEEAR
jgi:RNA polymerase sigma-70 factor, ECF subfamily